MPTVLTHELLDKTSTEEAGRRTDGRIHRP